MADISVNVKLTINQKNNILANINKIIREINVRLAELQKKYAEEIWDEAVFNYYYDYSPMYYGRSFSFEHAYKVTTSGGNFNFQFGKNFIGGHRADSGYIYDTMFVGGWHGGAPHNGSYYYRTPHPFYVHWGWEARKSDSPYEEIVNNWNEFIDGDGEALKKEIISSVISKYL